MCRTSHFRFVFSNCIYCPFNFEFVYHIVISVYTTKLCAVSSIDWICYLFVVSLVSSSIYWLAALGRASDLQCTAAANERAKLNALTNTHNKLIVSPTNIGVKRIERKSYTASKWIALKEEKKKQKCNENKQLRLLGKQAKIFVCAHKYIWSISYDLISYSVRSNGATVCYCVCVCARAREGSLLQPMYDISECVGVASCELWCLHCILAANTRFGQSSTGKKYLYDMSQT